MSENVVQIAGDPFALGDFGEMLDFLIRLAQPAVHAITLGKEGVARTDDDRKERGVEHGPAVDVKEQCLDGAHRANGCESDDCRCLGLEAKRKHGGSENKKGAGAYVDRHVQHSEKEHAADVNETVWIFQREESEIEKEKDNGPRDVERPNFRGGGRHYRIDEEETEIHDPQQRAPAVVLVPEYCFPRPQLEGAGCAGALSIE